MKSTRKPKSKQPVTMYQGQRIRHRDSGTFMADVTAHGGRERKVFKTLAEAKVFIDLRKVEAMNKGSEALALRARDRADAIEARELLGPEISILEAVRFYCDHHKPTGEAMTVSALADAYIAAPGRRGKRAVSRRPDTLNGLRWRLDAFTSTYGDRDARTITAEDITAWLDARDAVGINRKHYLAAVRGMFAYAVRQKSVLANPADSIDTPDYQPPAAEILTLDEIRSILAAAETGYTDATGKHRPTADALPALAVHVFCGLRPEELARMGWGKVSFENKLLSVDADVSRIAKHRRTVPLPDCLIDWLAPYHQKRGALRPFSKSTWERRKDAVEQASGVKLPHDFGRHAFASYDLAAHENPNRTALYLGHADTDLLYRTYRNIADRTGKPTTKAMGEAFYDIRPQRAPESNVIRMA